MAKKNKEPDKLSQDAAAAIAAGMSYGKWKSLQSPVKVEKVEKKIPDGWRVCEYCGKLYKPKTYRPQKYCEPYCGQQAREAKKRKALPTGDCT